MIFCTSFFGKIVFYFFVFSTLAIICIIILIFYECKQEERKTPEQKHIERIQGLINLFSNQKIKVQHIKFLDYQFNYGWPVEIIYEFQITIPINESVLLEDFDTYKKKHPPVSYEVFIKKKSDQTYIITCLDFDDKQNMI